ncbi:MAG: DUF1289 domain-containing protein [Pseudomonadota bacterium]
MTKIPSPCIDVCKHKLKGRHCIGCSMTERQKAEWNGQTSLEAQRAFLAMIQEQQAALGGKFLGWAAAYRRECLKAGVACPLDETTDA